MSVERPIFEDIDLGLVYSRRSGEDVLVSEIPTMIVDAEAQFDKAPAEVIVQFLRRDNMPDERTAENTGDWVDTTPVFPVTSENYHLSIQERMERTRALLRAEQRKV